MTVRDAAADVRSAVQSVGPCVEREEEGKRNRRGGRGGRQVSLTEALFSVFNILVTVNDRLFFPATS